MSDPIIPFSLKDAPALIEKLLPVQKLSVEAYKEQMAVQGKTLTALGSYWKGRKPLILNKACILGCLLPATSDAGRDLEIFERLMAMDEESFVARWKRRTRPKEIVATLHIERIADFFMLEPEGILPSSGPVDFSVPSHNSVHIEWREDIAPLARRRIEARLLPQSSYRDRVEQARRPEEVIDTVHDHIWGEVNLHLGTNAYSIAQLTEQLGIMRYGHRPRVGDTFCGSGQIAFEAARIGCDVNASDLNPIACMLTWGAFNIVGGSAEDAEILARQQLDVKERAQAAIDDLGLETDERGWRAKVFLYCVEARCPQSGWLVPMLPSRVVSTSRCAIAELVADPANKRYEIRIDRGVSPERMKAAELGTIVRDEKFGEGQLIHTVGSVTYKTKISTLRGDYALPNGDIENRLRSWGKEDFVPLPDDLLQERLYAVQWMRADPTTGKEEYEFRSADESDLAREQRASRYVKEKLVSWQGEGWVPDMKIEVGGPPRYQGLDFIRARGWTYWHHLFNPRQLLLGALLNRFSDSKLKFGLAQVLNNNCRASRWHPGAGPGATVGIFDNQALSTLFNYGCRGSEYAGSFLLQRYKNFPVDKRQSLKIDSVPASRASQSNDIYVTDPPYGDAVKYEEILDFFIAWLRKRPPKEFSGWTWDSRRSLAIKGEDETFRQEMVAAYRKMTENMPENGAQVIMFTHQSGSIWADMANIVWASGLRVTAAWYVATETESALRQGNNVKGTVLLIARKRSGANKTTRDDLAWEIQEEVQAQVNDLTGLNQQAKGLYRDENVFEDADIQMAGYAAALRVITRYSVIDGRDMTVEASRPRTKGDKTFVDSMIDFAVSAANQCLVPLGIGKRHWDALAGVERFYLKLLELESKGLKTLDNYQNFAKAFKVADYRPLMASQKANQARLKGAIEFGKNEMAEGSVFHQSTLRAILFAVYELSKEINGDDVLRHLALNVPDYYQNDAQRGLAIELADFLAKKWELLRPDEATHSRVLRELIRNHRIG